MDSLIRPLALSRIEPAECPWDELDAYADRNAFQTLPWLRFIERTQHATLAVGALHDADDVVGWFTGFIQKRLGVRILGSPFPGWGTPYLGFNLVPGADRRAAFACLPRFAFGEMRCLYLEVRCRSTGFHDLDGLGFDRGRTFQTSTVDLRPPEDEVFGRMSSACRRAIRKAERSRVVIEDVHDQGFADEYFAQLTEVFDRQGLKPHFGVERVRALVEEVSPSGNLLLLRARDANGRSIATGIFPMFNRFAYFWGGASVVRFQHLRPNEALMWHAIRRSREAGAAYLDMGGQGAYKAKYGAVATPVPTYSLARWPIIAKARRGSESILRRARHMTRVPPPFVPDEAQEPTERP